MRGVWFLEDVQRPIDGRGGNAVQPGDSLDLTGRSGLLRGKRSSRCRNCSSESTGIVLRLASIVGQRAIHRRTTNAEPACNFRRAQLFLNSKAMHFGGVDRRFAATVDAARHLLMRLFCESRLSAGTLARLEPG